MSDNPQMVPCKTCGKLTGHHYPNLHPNAYCSDECARIEGLRTSAARLRREFPNLPEGVLLETRTPGHFTLTLRGLSESAVRTCLRGVLATGGKLA